MNEPDNEQERREIDEDYDDIKRRFEKAFDSGGGPYRDESFIRDAIQVFCFETMLHASDTSGSKAARTIASRLMAFPDAEKEWRVTFPYIWLDKDKRYTDKEIQRRSIAFQVKQRINRGMKVTHAIAEVAASAKKSPQKVTKDYYEWLPRIEALEEMTKSVSEKYSKNQSQEKE